MTPLTKGKTAERELSHILAERLGVEIRRNLDQTRDGGADFPDVLGWSIEVKRVEKLMMGVWWDQSLRRATQHGKKPALAYRRSRHPWRFIVRMADISSEYAGQPDSITCEMDIAAFCLVVRESIEYK